MDSLRSLLRLKSAPPADHMETVTHPSEPTRTFSVYRERQVKEMCALHSLNNLFQEKYYTKQTLDLLCNDDDSATAGGSAPFFNPNRSALGTGNYNVSVILKAVQLRQHQCIWFNKTKSISAVNLKAVSGFILNVPSDYKIGGVIPLPWERKHWIAVAQIEGFYFNLDSKLDKAEFIGKEAELLTHLDKQLKSKDTQLLLVVSQEVFEAESWKTADY